MARTRGIVVREAADRGLTRSQCPRCREGGSRQKSAAGSFAEIFLRGEWTVLDLTVAVAPTKWEGGGGVVAS